MFLGTSCFGQFLGDESSKKQTLQGLSKLYNHDYKEAESLISPVIAKYKLHPVSYLLKAYMLQEKYMPIEQNAAQSAAYLSILKQCIAKAEVLNKTPAYSAEASFYLLAAYGYLSKYYHAKKDYIKAGNEARKAYSYLKKGYDYVKSNPEFYFTNGLYRYYREQYPESHPQIKPIIYFFADGNKSLGLRDLKSAATYGLFTKVEAQVFLTSINLKYENNATEALKYARLLHDNYPNNNHFLLMLVESLVANKKWNEASIANTKLGKYKSTMSQVAYAIFNGEILLNSNEYEKAFDSFEKANSFALSAYGDEDLKSMALLGMGKAKLALGQKSKAKELLEDCLEIAEYKRIRMEANLALKNL